MKAKDTVMSDAELFEIWDERLVLPSNAIILQRNTAQRQAEISFKAGMKEVVNWIKSNSKDALIRDSAPQMFMTGFAKWEWLVFLKENGLEE